MKYTVEATILGSRVPILKTDDRREAIACARKARKDTGSTAYVSDGRRTVEIL